MPMHDWTKVDAGAFHDFHGSWIYAIHHALNGGLLPDGFYAMAEQSTGDVGPDVITLQDVEGFNSKGGGPAVLEMAPPKVRFTAVAKSTKPQMRPRRLIIRHVNRDRVVAILEIVSRSNKTGPQARKDFVGKIVSAVSEGIHAVVIDPYPPSKRDPEGFHSRIWKKLGGKNFTLPAEQPLCLSSYEADNPRRCFVELLALGQTIPDMPLFLRSGLYVTLPLEQTYESAWQFTPKRYKAILTSPS